MKVLCRVHSQYYCSIMCSDYTTSTTDHAITTHLWLWRPFRWFRLKEKKTCLTLQPCNIITTHLLLSLCAQNQGTCQSQLILSICCLENKRILQVYVSDGITLYPTIILHTAHHLVFLNISSGRQTQVLNPALSNELHWAETLTPYNWWVEHPVSNMYLKKSRKCTMFKIKGHFTKFNYSNKSIWNNRPF
jgi:hypothetical protein